MYYPSGRIAASAAYRSGQSSYVRRQLFNIDILLWKRDFNSMFSKFSVHTTQQPIYRPSFE